MPVIACKQKSSDTGRVKKLFSYYTVDAEKLFSKIKWVDLDVSDNGTIDEALEGIKVVYHCAGNVSFHSKQRKKLFKINEEGTANIVNACLEKNIKLCHVSSIATINNLDYKSELTESVFWKTSGKESDYAISKYNGEREVWRGMEEGLSAVIVNPGVVLSAGFWNQSSSRLFAKCYGGNKFYTTGYTGYVDARDVAAIMVKLVEQELFGQRYIVIENNYTFKDILERIQENFGQKKPTINASRSMLNLAGFFERIASKITGKEPALTKALIDSALNSQKLSNQKIKAALNHNFNPVYKAIPEICEHFKADLKNP